MNISKKICQTTLFAASLAFAAGAVAQDKSAKQPTDKAIIGVVPMVIMVPVQFQVDAAAKGCWTKLYTEKNFKGDSFT